MRHALLLAPLAMFALAAPALAGGAECQKAAQTAGMDHKHCTASKEECMKYMQDARNHGWLGIEYDQTENGNMVIGKVVSGSPAEKAGFAKGDVLTALNGIALTDANKDKLAAARKDLWPGSNVTYSIKRNGYSKDVSATLGKMPDDVYQAMVTEHMKEHVDVAAK
ncbi:MAG TPA: PDZ domain-containing protein [Candidatus Polarisedimenticolaceae bacterium]|nr:PDZ domain-containing protein [Candidatus Polarisedimenticolaceae bacterium]